MPSLDDWPGDERRHPRLSTPQWAVRAPLAVWLEQQARQAGEGYRVLDVGCDPKPYYPFFAERASEYIGVDVVPHAAADLVGRISRPVYGVGEQSGIKLRRVPRISWLLLEGVFLALAREVRDPRLPPARVLLRAPRDPDDDARRARPRCDRGRCCG